MDKQTQWRINEILKKVTPLDFQPVLCVCSNDTYARLSQFQYLPAMNPIPSTTPISYSKSCSTCGNYPCEIDTGHMTPDWDGFKDYCSRWLIKEIYHMDREKELGSSQMGWNHDGDYY